VTNRNADVRRQAVDLDLAVKLLPNGTGRQNVCSFGWLDKGAGADVMWCQPLYRSALTSQLGVLVTRFGISYCASTFANTKHNFPNVIIIISYKIAFCNAVQLGKQAPNPLTANSA
jgi:hypothetical protein